MHVDKPTYLLTDYSSNPKSVPSLQPSAALLSLLTGEQLLLIRDGLVFSLLWQTCFRGFNAGGVRLDNLVLPTGGSALSQLGMQAGAKLHLKPDRAKNKKEVHCQITLHM